MATTKQAGHPQRNADCPCGSGIKYKRCCLARQQRQEAEQRQAVHTRVAEQLAEANQALAKEKPKTVAEAAREAAAIRESRLGQTGLKTNRYLTTLALAGAIAGMSGLGAAGGVPSAGPLPPPKQRWPKPR